MKLAVLAFLVIGLFLKPTLSPATTDELSFVTLDDFPPYTWMSYNGPRGIDVDIIHEISNRTDIPISIIFVPWKRVILMTKNGEADASFAAFKTKDRQEFATYLEPPMHYSIYKLFVKKSNQFEFAKLEDLYGKTIAKNVGFVISEPFDKAVAEGKIEVIEGKDASRNIRLVAAGRADAFIGNENEIKYQLKQMELAVEITPLPRPLRVPRGAFLMISKAADIKDKPEMIDLISKTLSSMTKDGTLNSIYDRYLK